jgi:hypothetical protein
VQSKNAVTCYSAESELSRSIIHCNSSLVRKSELSKLEKLSRKEIADVILFYNVYLRAQHLTLYVQASALFLNVSCISG